MRNMENESSQRTDQADEKMKDQGQYTVYER